MVSGVRSYPWLSEIGGCVLPDDVIEVPNCLSQPSSVLSLVSIIASADLWRTAELDLTAVDELCPDGAVMPLRVCPYLGHLEGSPIQQLVLRESSTTGGRLIL
jgi:hypothetical protein